MTAAGQASGVQVRPRFIVPSRSEVEFELAGSSCVGAKLSGAAQAMAARPQARPVTPISAVSVYSCAFWICAVPRLPATPKEQPGPKMLSTANAHAAFVLLILDTTIITLAEGQAAVNGSGVSVKLAVRGRRYAVGHEQRSSAPGPPIDSVSAH